MSTTLRRKHFVNRSVQADPIFPRRKHFVNRSVQADPIFDFPPIFPPNFPDFPRDFPHDYPHGATGTPAEWEKRGYSRRSISVTFGRENRGRSEVFLKKTGAQLWIQHDFLGNAKLNKAPVFNE